MSNELSNPKESIGDFLYDMAKGAVSEIPYAGGLLSEAIKYIWNPPIQAKLHNWRETVATAIKALIEGHNKHEVHLHELNKEVFGSTVVKASLIAAGTNSEVKLQALKNAVVNSVFAKSIGELYQELFLQLINELSEVHITILKFFQSPEEWYVKKGLTKSQNQLKGVFFAAFPELVNHEELVHLVFRDLSSRKLCPVESFGGLTTGRDTYHKKTTPLGDKFLAFIEEPKTV